jgi:flagellin-like hook-associated protein FlgL
MSEAVGYTSTTMINRSNIASLHNTQKGVYDQIRKINSQSQFSTKEELHEGGKFHSFTSTVEDIARAEEYQRNLKRALVQMEQTDVILGNIIDDVAQAKGFLTQARTPLGRDMFIDTRMREHLNTLVSNLNARFNDKALFAGYDTDILPVNADAVYQSNLVYDSKNQIWVATSNYAVGDQSVKQIMSDDNIEVKYSIVASDPAFVKIIGAYHQILSNVEDENNIKLGYDALDEAFRSLTEKRADFGSKMRIVENSVNSWVQIEEDLISDYQDLYGNNPAAMAELISRMHALMDSQKQTVDIIALLLQNQNSILDRL